MRLDDREHIVQVILEMIATYWFDGHLNFLSVLEFIAIIDIDIQ